MGNVFDRWNEKKQETNSRDSIILAHNRDIWWTTIGWNIGQEQNGDSQKFQRPVLILKILSKDTCLVLPLTSSNKKHPLRIPVGMVEDKKASAIISQIKTVDFKRLVNRISRLDKEKFEIIRKAVKDLL